MIKKYMLHPCYVDSKNDPDCHLITAGVLAILYGVKMEECIVMKNDSEDCLGINMNKIIHLYPSYIGNYQLPENI